MVQAIGSSNAYPAPASGESGASAGVLQAQLNRYQTQLADWCNCPSGKTPEGKVKIQQLQNQAHSVKAQLERMDASQARHAATAGSSNANQALNQAAPNANASTPTSPAVGGLVDTFA